MDLKAPKIASTEANKIRATINPKTMVLAYFGRKIRITPTATPNSTPEKRKAIRSITITARMVGAVPRKNILLRLLVSFSF